MHNIKGGLMKKLARYLVSVKEELKKVRWPKRKEMVAYSTATIAVIIFFMLFFVLSDTIIGTIVKVFS
jgi:preprotein translocase SecE subunit